jgi:SAM-dependent methyltransferase
VYYFGLYHWRTRARRVLVALAVGTLAAVAARSGPRWRRAASLLALGWAVRKGGGTVRSLCSPPPWVVERYKYEALARALPTAGAQRWLDLGCGTGRSLVGVSALVPEGCRVVGLDVFDDRIILGNGPALAAGNARKAGLEAAMVRGDATRLPVADGSQDVVTACRLLHDLPREAALATLEETRRICRPDGTVGLLEIPVTHDGTTDPPAEYWPALVSEAGLAADRVEEVPRRRSEGAYVVVVARP